MENRVALEVLAFDDGGFLGSTMHTSRAVSVGSDPDAMLHLDDPSVSPEHAVFLLDGDDCCIKDLGSHTGTWVNGARVSATRALAPTDEITIGGYRLRIKIYKTTSPEAASARPRRRARLPGVKPGDGEPTTLRAKPVRVRKVAPQAVARKPEPADISDDLLGLFDELRSSAKPAPGRSTETDLTDETPTLGLRPGPITIPLAWTPPQKEASPPAQASAAPVSTATMQFSAAQASVAPVPSFRGPPPHVTAPEEPISAGWSSSWEEDDDDEDEDDSNFVPAFDLLEALAARGLPSGISARGAVVEVIEYCRDRVIAVRHLGPSQVLSLPGSRVVIGRCRRDGGFALETTTAGRFAVRQAGRWLSPREAELLAAGDKLGLAPGMQIAVDVRGEHKVMVHLVQRAPAVPRPAMSLHVDKGGVTSGASSTAVHAIALALLGLVAMDPKHEEADLNAGRFATIDVKELDLEPPPPPPPPPEVVPEAEAEAAVPTKQPAPTPPSPHTKQPRTAKHLRASAKESEASAGPEQPTPSAAKILSSLGGVTPSTTTATAITNLDAAPHGAGGGFKVSGAIGKAPGDGLKIASAGSGSGTLGTKSATEVGAKVGRVKGEEGTGVVRARVTAIPQAITGEGTLARGEIQKVVNAHVHQVQACYERQLMKDPSLGGKITLEWVINGSGAVASVRVKQSTIHSVDVATCIQNAIRGWKFPSPQGGAVTVTYPFAFSTLGN
jgi:outer membrane biosynthesis protein TonB